MSSFNSVITGTGSFVPQTAKTNKDFTAHSFYDADSIKIDQEPDVIVKKFEQITGIAERRYADDNMLTSDMALIAAKLAIEDAGIDAETIDQIILAHNFGDIIKDTNQSDSVPSLASRVKHGLGIKNPYCIPYDILFGCPGWIQGIIQANSFFKAGEASTCLIIGTETLSRVIDDFDRDSMIFSDGAGACILEYKEEEDIGILSTAVMAHCEEELGYLFMGKSNLPEADARVRYIKMKGRKVYEYAMTYVPMAMKQCLDKAGLDITDVKKIFLHQANEKMDEGIIKALYKLYDNATAPEFVMPMCIHKFGNSSVATVPTLYDLVSKGQMENHSIQKGDIVLFASVGAGMNINAFCYKV
jgi:3-oxoacyl-[acyl-carrier-protein] synthase-3